ncbi:NnrS family protein [Azospirillum isscasi]|uniref:NnrS family protein n=1 Tax=Azospirillum isscasi TaxID=3053926 RepID=A0ABU0WJC6_9PROT|nr:NnrS family protein [Azospirillum isscasi]MDQ2104328.1 NnrS family protein [Azospirillum isscasi]
MNQSNPQKGVALFSCGFRPFFLFGALYAAGLIAVWVPWFLGLIHLETDLSPVSWHTHEMLFGFVPAIMGGFLLTAVPGWTGRPPVTGWPLAALFGAWIVGRLGVAGSEALGPLGTALLTLLFPVALTAVAGWEIVAAKNWRDLKVPAVLTVLIAAQSLFHWEQWQYGQSVHGAGLAVAAVLTLKMLNGGRLIPALTGNWLKARGATRLPPAFSRFDGVAMGVGLLALIAWVLRDDGVLDDRLTGALLLAAGSAQAVRLLRWQAHRTLAEPLILALHVAYAFIPAGFLLAAWAALSGSAACNGAALHAWTAGAIGGMSLAVMTRATLGHTGRALTASWPTVAIHAAVTAAAGLRIAAALDPQRTMLLMPPAGALWAAAFLMFALVYGRMLLTPRL